MVHYLTLLIIPFGLIAVAAAHREVGARVWRFAIISYCIIVMTTPLMSTLTFRRDIFDWRVAMVAELGFVSFADGVDRRVEVQQRRGRGRNQAKHQDTKLG